MKRINSFMLAAVAIFAAASCQKEMANEPLQNEGGDFTITASIGADTKTVLSDDAVGNKIYWAPGDKISVFNASGAEVAFSTDIAANSTTATFTNDAAFEKPDGKLVAIYPDRNDKESTFDAETGKITNLHIGGTVQAIAETFDSQYAPAVGVTNSDTPNDMAFHNVHCLIKFTIGGTKAPSTVVLKNNGLRAICGLYHYNINSGEIEQGGGYTYINVDGPFAVGETYYIPMIPGICGNGISLEFDGKVVKNTGETKTLMPNKIYNLGILEAPAAEEEPVVSAIDVTRVWGYYSPTAAWSNSLVSSLDGNDRSLAMDDEYIYIPETNTSGNIHKFKIADGSYVGTLPKSADMTLGTHYVSCARTVKKSDDSYVLLVCNLSLGEGLRIFAYVDGTNNAPVTMTTVSNGRRWGDKFTVTGTWENGKMWFRSYDDRGMVGYFPLTGTNTTWDFVEPHAVDGGSAFDANNISEVTWVPGTEGFCLLNTNSTAGAHVMSGNAHGAYSEVKTYSSLAKTFGYNFFEAADEKFVAWVSLANGNDKPRLQIVQSDATTKENMVATFDNLATRLVYEAPLQNADDMNTAGVGGGNTVCDCCVREIDGTIYIAAMAQKAGLSLFKVTAK